MGIKWLLYFMNRVEVCVLRVSLPPAAAPCVPPPPICYTAPCLVPHVTDYWTNLGLLFEVGFVLPCFLCHWILVRPLLIHFCTSSFPSVCLSAVHGCNELVSVELFILHFYNCFSSVTSPTNLVPSFCVSLQWISLLLSWRKISQRLLLSASTSFSFLYFSLLFLPLLSLPPPCLAKTVPLRCINSVVILLLGDERWYFSSLSFASESHTSRQYCPPDSREGQNVDCKTDLDYLVAWWWFYLSSRHAGLFLLFLGNAPVVCCVYALGKKVTIYSKGLMSPLVYFVNINFNVW